MTPFRPFLSPRHPFEWNEELDLAFTQSKEAIIAAIKYGVEIFDPKRRTCLRPDWSKKGIGYFLLQKHCGCPSQLPDCCRDGWKITLSGSRFLQDAEARYAPIEGEALAVAWGLEQTKYFTLGCDDLLVVTDHKPLTKILGDRLLDEIQNTRLFRLKQRTLPWNFTIAHLPGTSNHAADATSRHPSPAGTISLVEQNDCLESAIMASIQRTFSVDAAISWDRLAQVTLEDQNMQLLLQCIQNGFPNDLRHPSIEPYWKYKHGLYELNGVVLYDDRAVIPLSLRPQVISTLHAAHQGVSTMEARAQQTVFWPGMTADIADARATCKDCIANAPSQPRLPPAEAKFPTTPFEAIVADFFKCAGYHYLAIADRLSAWTEVFKCVPGSPQSGAEGLIGCLRNCFARFGVPEELSSDGGPEFTASATKKFLHQWGVQHRGSSAYNPQSNGRAEVAVKTAKRLLRSNVASDGSLNTDSFLRAMLQLRNTPDPDCRLSPAQVVFGRPLRDGLSFTNRLEKFTNPHIRPTWREAWSEKEVALRNRYHRTSESLKEHSRPLPPLSAGDWCYIQNQTGNHPNRWDRSGVIVDVLGHDSYLVKVDGSGRLTKRNRRFLRQFVRASPFLSYSRSKPMLPPVDPTLAEGDHQINDTHPPIEHSDNTPLSVVTPCIAPLPPSPQPEPMSENHSSHELSLPDPNINQPARPEPSINQPARPQRTSRAPRRYEPETGKWVSQ